MFKFKEKRTLPQRIVFGVVFVLFTIYAISLLYPFVWTFISTMKDTGEYLDNPFGMPKRFTLYNFVRAYTELKIEGVGLFGMFFNSLLLTGCTTFLAVFGSSCVAYCLSKYKFKGSGIIYAAAVFILIIPTTGCMPSLYKLMVKNNWTNNVLMTSILMGGCFGMYFMLMYGTFQSLSWTYAEAGFIDGANDFTVFFRIMLPQVRGPLLSLSLVCAIGVWNEYLYPYMFMDKHPTLSTGIYKFQIKILQGSEKNYPVFFAGILISCLPMLLLFICFQEKLLENTQAGGIKG